jgi:hypothetical protein
MKQVYAVGVECDSLGSYIDWPIGRVVKGIDCESKEKAEDPTLPKRWPAVHVRKAVSRNEQENKNRPEC